MSLLPTDVLKKQKCDICLNYLSIGPVKIRKTHEKICGRCSNINLGEECVTSLYNSVAQNFLFKCKNHYSGCKEIIKFDSNHEESCPEFVFNCPLCSFQSNGCQLSSHLSQKHTKRMMQNSTFRTKFRSGQKHMFVQDQYDYLIVIHIIVEDYYLNIGVINLCENSKLLNYSLNIFQANENHLHSIEGNFMIKFEVSEYSKIYFNEIECFNWDDWTQGKIQMNPHINLEQMEQELDEKRFKLESKEEEIDNVSRELLIEKRRIDGEKLRFSKSRIMQLLQNIVSITGPSVLICSSCNRTFMDEIYLCARNHSVCRNCLKSICGKCQIFCHWHSATNILNGNCIFCEWDGCKKQCNFMNYLVHKQKCPFRRYRCPDRSCKFEGLKGELIEHWHYTEPSLLTVEGPLFLLKQSYQFYWMIKEFKELVFVQLLMDDVTNGAEEHCCSITVWENEAVFPENYQIKFFANKYFRYISTLNQVGASKKSTVVIPDNQYYKLMVFPK